MNMVNTKEEEKVAYIGVILVTACQIIALLFFYVINI